MKIKEAIENLKYLISGDCTDNQMDFVEEIEMGIQALEKQIPKKGTIKYLSSYTDDPPVLLCPNCQEHIPTEGCNFYKYCYKCGQSLDWSDHPTEKGGAEE